MGTLVLFLTLDIIFFLKVSLVHTLWRSVLFNLQIFGNVPTNFLFDIILWSILWMMYILFNYVMFYSPNCTLCWQVFHADFRGACILLLLNRVFCKHQLDQVIWFFCSNLSLLIFCLLLCWLLRGELKSPTIVWTCFLSLYSISFYTTCSDTVN